MLRRRHRVTSKRGGLRAPAVAVAAAVGLLAGCGADDARAPERTSTATTPVATAPAPTATVPTVATVPPPPQPDQPATTGARPDCGRVGGLLLELVRGDVTCDEMRQVAGGYDVDGAKVQELPGGWTCAGGTAQTRPIVFTCSLAVREFVAKE